MNLVGQEITVINNIYNAKQKSSPVKVFRISPAKTNSRVDFMTLESVSWKDLFVLELHFVSENNLLPAATSFPSPTGQVVILWRTINAQSTHKCLIIIILTEFISLLESVSQFLSICLSFANNVWGNLKGNPDR